MVFLDVKMLVDREREKRRERGRGRKKEERKRKNCWIINKLILGAFSLSVARVTK